MFNKGVQDNTKEAIHQILPIQIVPNFPKYLGVPIVVGKSKS
jgi:hypothetical protein